MVSLKRPPAETPGLYEQDGKGYDATAYAHYFIGGSDWFVTEYSPEYDEAFGWACLNGDRQNAELGYIPLDALEEVRAPIRINDQTIPGVLKVEYDEHWTPKTLREAIAALPTSK